MDVVTSYLFPTEVPTPHEAPAESLVIIVSPIFGAQGDEEISFWGRDWSETFSGNERICDVTKVLAEACGLPRGRDINIKTLASAVPWRKRAKLSDFCSGAFYISAIVPAVRLRGGEDIDFPAPYVFEDAYVYDGCLPCYQKDAWRRSPKSSSSNTICFF